VATVVNIYAWHLPPPFELSRTPLRVRHSTQVVTAERLWRRRGSRDTYRGRRPPPRPGRCGGRVLPYLGHGNLAAHRFGSPASVPGDRRSPPRTRGHRVVRRPGSPAASVVTGTRLRVPAPPGDISGGRCRVGITEAARRCNTRTKKLAPDFARFCVPFLKAPSVGSPYTDFRGMVALCVPFLNRAS